MYEVIPISLIPMKKLNIAVELVHGAYEGLLPRLLMNWPTCSVTDLMVVVYAGTMVLSIVAPLEESKVSADA